jgi:phosphoribosylglycinamide formyltransferase 1
LVNFLNFAQKLILIWVINHPGSQLTSSQEFSNCGLTTINNPHPPSETMPCLVVPHLPQPPIVTKLRIGIMASGSGSNFVAIATAIAEQRLQAEIAVLIYNNPGIPVIEKAATHNIPAVFHDHRGLPRAELDAQIVQTLQNHQVNCVVMAGWMRVVTPVLIDAFPHRIINIHPSLLPSFPGIRAIEQALAAKVKISGCTVHLVSPAVDSGLILIQAAVPVLPNDTPASLHGRIQEQEHRILPAALGLI